MRNLAIVFICCLYGTVNAAEKKCGALADSRSPSLEVLKKLNLQELSENNSPPRTILVFGDSQEAITALRDELPIALKQGTRRFIQISWPIVTDLLTKGISAEGGGPHSLESAIDHGLNFPSPDPGAQGAITYLNDLKVNNMRNSLGEVYSPDVVVLTELTYTPYTVEGLIQLILSRIALGKTTIITFTPKYKDLDELRSYLDHGMGILGSSHPQALKKYEGRSPFYVVQLTSRPAEEASKVPQHLTRENQSLNEPHR